MNALNINGKRITNCNRSFNVFDLLINFFALISLNNREKDSVEQRLAYNKNLLWESSHFRYHSIEFFHLLEYIYLNVSFKDIMILRTFEWSPLNNWRNDAWVPVVPLTPRNFNCRFTRSKFFKSINRSWIHIHARLPTVVNCAGLWIQRKMNIS